MCIIVFSRQPINCLKKYFIDQDFLWFTTDLLTPTPLPLYQLLITQLCHRCESLTRQLTVQIFYLWESMTSLLLLSVVPWKLLSLRSVTEVQCGGIKALIWSFWQEKRFTCHPSQMWNRTSNWCYIPLITARNIHHQWKSLLQHPSLPLQRQAELANMGSILLFCKSRTPCLEEENDEWELVDLCD